MKLNTILRFYILLGCGLFISCQNTQKNVEHLGNSSYKVLEETRYPKELDDYLEKNTNKRAVNANDRSIKIFKNFDSDQELPNLNYKSSAGPNDIRKMKILRKVDHYLPNFFDENKNKNFTPKALFQSEMEGKEFKNVKSSKRFNKNPPANRIKRQSPKIFRYTGNTETKKRISSADKFLKLDEKEREQLLERIFNEIKRKLNKPKLGNGYVDDDESFDAKPRLLIVNPKSNPKREKNSGTEPPISKAVENPYSGKTYAVTPPDSFNDAIEIVIPPRLKTNPGFSSIGKQTGRSNVNTDRFTTNSKAFSKREDRQYQKDGIHLTTFMPETSEQKSVMEEPVEVRRVEENKQEMSSKGEITTDQSKDISFTQSEKLVKKGNKNGQPQLYQILRNPTGTNTKFGQNNRSLDSSKVSERMNNNSDEDRELLEYIKSNVKNCLDEMRKDRKEEEEKPEAKERNRSNEITVDTDENHPKEVSPELTKQLSLFDMLNSLNPNSPAFQILWNIVQLTASKPNILLGENQRARAENLGLNKSPLMAEEKYLDDASSEENGNDSYDTIFQTDLKNLDDFVGTYGKPNVGATRFDRFWGTDLLDELFL